MPPDFRIDDIVRVSSSMTPKHDSDLLLRVTGVIHDQERLFVTDDSGGENDGKEFEVPFADVIGHYREVLRENNNDA